MKIAILVGLLLASPALAQTTNDDTPAAESWWDQVGAGFFSDATMQTLRPEFEVRAHWTALSPDDQAAVKARCVQAKAQNGDTAPTQKIGDADLDQSAPAGSAQDQTATTEAPPTPQQQSGTQTDISKPSTSITGNNNGAEIQAPDPSATPAPYTGLAGTADDQGVRFSKICDLIMAL